MGTPTFWWAFHLVLGPLTGGYCGILLWFTYKDVLTVEFLSDKEVTGYEPHSFAFNLKMISGHSELWKALIYPCTDLLPINGLEY